MIHITNGDGFGQVLALSPLPGQIIPWRDVLHEGPVPAGLPLKELSDLRAEYLCALPGAPPLQKARRQFRQRDDAFVRSRKRKKLVLWFEHDLYDQLQLIQVLAEMGRRGFSLDRAELVCIDEHPSVERFIGLGQLAPDTIEALYEQHAKPLTEMHVQVATAVWQAFRDPTPEALNAWVEQALNQDSDVLPFLAPAMSRFLEQYPDESSGLGRTERQILEKIQAEDQPIHVLFDWDRDVEAAPFLGDTTFLSYVKGLKEAARPGLRLMEPVFSTANLGGSGQRGVVARITDDGHRYLAGELDFAADPGFDRHLGGVHLMSSPRWRRIDSDYRIVDRSDLR